jgi:hypothetical protein
MQEKLLDSPQGEKVNGAALCSAVSSFNPRSIAAKATPL